MRKVAFAALAAIVFAVAMAPPAQAVALYWTFRGVASVDDCLSRASYAAGVYGASNIERGSNHVQGALEPDMFLTFFCLPSAEGATGLLVVAADDSVSDDDVISVRSELWSIFTSS
ncbi:MAG TPA: hypothetical protein PKY87_06660 [Terricaulis sp.]|nr:hypothetical protein [Terricaulis sp.]